MVQLTNVNATNSDRPFINIIKPGSERYINNKMKEGKCTVLYHCISSRRKNVVLSNGRNVAMGVAYSVMLFQKISDESTRNHANLSQDS